MTHLRKTVVSAVAVIAVVTIAMSAGAQGFRPEPVFNVDLLADRSPVVAGDDLRLAVVIKIDKGWHINTMIPVMSSWCQPPLNGSFPKGGPRWGWNFLTAKA